MSKQYPLYCVDLGTDGTDDCQYYGPYKTSGEAVDAIEHATDIVRPCRRVLPSEIRYDNDKALQTLAEGSLPHLLDWLVDEIDEAAASGDLPPVAWHRFGEQIVSGKQDTNTLPTAANFNQWIDVYLQVDAYICEGDE